MTTPGRSSAARDDLARIIHGVRRRWRARVALRGGAIVLGIAAVAVVLGVLLVQQGDGSVALITAARTGVIVVVIAAIAWFLAIPLGRRVSDRRVALYIEEHEPGLEAAILSAVEVTGSANPASDRSPALVERLVQSATVKARKMDAERHVERGALQRASGMLGAVVAGALLLAFFGPDAFRDGLRTLLVPWSTADAAAAYSIDVTPGSTTIARGGDLRIAARLSGFTADEVEIAVRRGTEAEWQRMPMGAGSDSAERVFRLFDLDSAAEYFVEATGIRSPVFRIDVKDLPYVSRIHLEYRFPAYLGRAAERVEDGGDIVAIRGTTVIVTATPTIPASAGRIVLEGGRGIPMVPGDDGTLSAPIVLDSSGFYRIELATQGGVMVNASLDYAIDVLADLPPTISFTRPSRDIKVSSLEEVFTEVRAQDDNGVGTVELLYSVNGGEEQRVALHRAARRPRTELSAGHTFFLEEFSLQPGDIVSYYARATDARASGPPGSATTDIYFMEIRPFDREYRQAEQGGGGGEGGGGEPPSVLSQRQREIIAGTFNTERDRSTVSDREFRENVATLVLAQGRLRSQVDELNERMKQRGGIDADSTLRAIAEELPKASAAMKEAEEQLGRRQARAALPHEQRALQHLQRAEAAFREVQVAFGGGGGGGGGGGQPDAEDLADLFELETDRLRNQYETVEQGQRQAQNQEVDETLERLKQLASRQQRENERARQLADNMRGPAGGGGGGEGQRQLARETEELARQLERLARENPQSGLGETARRLQDAANEMRRSAAGGNAGGASGAEALERLQSARRLLDESRESRLDGDVRDAMRRAEALAEEQRRVAADVAGLAGAADRSARERRIEGRKESQAGEVRQLESMLDRLARESRREQAAASRKLQEAAGSIRDNRLEEKIRFSRSIVRGGSEEYARNFEEQIGANIEELRERIAEAAGTMADAPEKRVAQALDRTRDLVRGLESLEERMRDRGEASPSGEAESPGSGQQPGDPGREGQPGGAQPGSSPGETSRAGPGAPSQGQPGGASSGAPGAGRGRLSPDDTRQFRREFRERRESAQALRRELAGQGRDVGDLDQLIARLRELEARRSYDDAEEIARLQGAVIEGFKAFEFALWRDVEQQTGTEPRLGGADEVPAGFRALVEEYYRSLARGGRK